MGWSCNKKLLCPVYYTALLLSNTGKCATVYCLLICFRCIKSMNAMKKNNKRQRGGCANVLKLK